jgi:hypothetical protein
MLGHGIFGALVIMLEAYVCRGFGPGAELCDARVHESQDCRGDDDPKIAGVQKR